MDKPYVLGIDIGGQTAKCGIVNARGEVLAQSIMVSNKHDDAQSFITALAATLQKLISDSDLTDQIRGIGVGAPNGNYYTGEIKEAPNLSWAHEGNVPFSSMLSEAMGGMPVALTNDANAAAVGEMTYGAAKGLKNFIMITLGTGVGSGIVIDGRLVHGSTGAAGELGHAILYQHGRKCSCGREGCLETYTSARGIVQTYCELKGCPVTPDITSKMIGELAHQGDPIALKTWETVGDQLGLAMANAVTFSAPEAIFLMGGPAQVGEPLLRPLRAAFDKYILNIFSGTCQIRMSELRANEVAILGAAALLKMK